METARTYDSCAVLPYDPEHRVLQWEFVLPEVREPQSSPERKLLCAILERALEDAKDDKDHARADLRNPMSGGVLCRLLDLDHARMLRALEGQWQRLPKPLLQGIPLKRCPGIQGKRCRHDMPATWAHCETCRGKLRSLAQFRRHRRALHPCPGVPGTRLKGCGQQIFGRLCNRCYVREQNHRRDKIKLRRA